MIAGVYTITSPSGGAYVGSAVNFASRWRIHLHHLRAGTHHNIKLQNAATKYGIDALAFKKLIVCLPEHALMYEQIAIDALCPRYNIARVAGRTTGYKHTEETKAAFKGRTPSRGNTGKQHTDETRARISAAKRGVSVPALVGREVSVETREKLRKARAGMRFGPMSDAVKAKISAANKGKKPTASALEASIAARAGKKISPEATARRIAAYKETCAKRKMKQ